MDASTHHDSFAAWMLAGLCSSSLLMVALALLLHVARRMHQRVQNAEQDRLGLLRSLEADDADWVNSDVDPVDMDVRSIASLEEHELYADASSR